MISNKQTIALSGVAVGAAIVLFASAPLVAMHQAYAQWWGGWGGGLVDINIAVFKKILCCPITFITLRFGNLRIGQPVIAIGNPFGLE
jgi:hypothetical protein